jgi:3',5'-cyclic AMP phosphodiesterase CpdA
MVEEIPSHPKDWLIIAGDVGETPDQLEWTLQLLVKRFRNLAWVPGNHELWTLPQDPVQLRGEARYRYLVEICRSMGVLTPEDPYPVLECTGIEYVLAPLFLLYDYSFRPSDLDREGALARAWQTEVVCTDEFFLYPDPYPNREAWCRARVEWTTVRLEQVPSKYQLVLVSHFPLRQDLVYLPNIPMFSLWCGTQQTEDWHQRYRAAVVVMGHLHMPGVRWRDGIRFEEVSLGYPNQWGHTRHLRGPREVLPGTSSK